MNWSLKNGQLTVEGKKYSHSSGKPVITVLDLGPKLILLLEPQGGGIVPNNVLSIGADLKINWEVEVLPNIMNSVPTYTYLRMEDNDIVAYSSMGTDVTIDPASGRIKVRDPEARPW